VRPPAARRAALPRAPSLRPSDLRLLLKPKIASLSALVGGAGFHLRAPERIGSASLLHTLAGITLLAAAAAALNQLIERRLDARMVRTAGRPLPSGRMSPAQALALGIALAAGGILILRSAGSLAASLGALSLLIYLFAYTPLKRRTPLAIAVGAVSGAIPPLIGWTAAGGGLDPMGGFLFLVLFVWQVPHFLAIARIHREDYARAGFRVCPREGAGGAWIVGGCLALLLAGLAPVAMGWMGAGHGTASLALGLGLLAFGIDAAARRSIPAARRLLAASLIYIPAFFLVLLSSAAASSGMAAGR
jgi:heme o synthase